MMRTRCPALLVLALGFALGGAGCGGGAGRTPETSPAEESAAYRMRLAQSLLNGGRVTEALEAADDALVVEPDNAGVHLMHGRLCIDAGMMDRAEESFMRALELDPHITDARIFLGMVLQETDRAEAAEEQYLAALESPAYPTPEKAHLGLGLLYAGQGRDGRAEEQLRRAVGVNPRYFTAHFHLASLLERTGKLDEAASEFEVAEPAFRKSGEYWYRRGLTYYRLGQTARARDSLQRVREVAPGSESAAQAAELLDVIGS